MATKSETKTTTVSVLASKLKVDNILQFSLIQTTLQDNFKAIVQALSSHDNDLLKMKQANKNDHDKINSLHTSQENLAKQLKEIKDSMLKLHHENQSLKNKTKSIVDKNSPNPESNQNTSIKNGAIQDFRKQINGMKQRMEKVDTSITQINKNNGFTQMDIQKLKKQIANLGQNNDYGNKFKQMQKLLKDLDTKQKETLNKIKQFESEKAQNNKNKIDENKFIDIQQTINKLRQKLDNFIGLQYKQNSQKLNERLSQLEKMIQQNKSSVEQEKRLRGKLSQQVWKVHDTVSKSSQSNFNQQLTSDAIKQLKREILQLQRKINDLTSNKFSFDTTMHESPNKLKSTDLSPSKGQIAHNNDLRQQMLERLKQLKSDMLKNFKKMDWKSQGQLNSDKQRLDTIDDAILRLDHLIGDKANLESVNKLVAHLENKISYIYNIFLGQSQEDACIARKNWVCLSCDKKLDKYQGKIGAHLINSQLKSKTLEQETVGGGMLLKPSKSRVDLPNVYKNKKL